MKRTHQLRVVGVALSGRDGSPVVVFEEPLSGDFLPVNIDPYEAEMVIRGFVGDDAGSAVSWLADLLTHHPPKRAVIEMDKDGRPYLRLSARRHLALGEGLALARRLGFPIMAEDGLFESTRGELAFLSDSGAFLKDFLYLTPPQYAPNMPLE